ncbi:hypothetical protein [Streptomyces erythrochromogenes]|uniref:hypothetical protein n=1 Tax=Streptomyces erythrochromogenes TaxID=285574 RepID=UPI0038167F23
MTNRSVCPPSSERDAPGGADAEPRSRMRLSSPLPRRVLLPFVAAVALLATGGTAAVTAADACGSIITAPLAPPVRADDPCPSTDPVVCRIRVMPMDEKVEAQRTRIRYHDLLEAMHRTESDMRAAGASDSERARPELRCGHAPGACARLAGGGTAMPGRGQRSAPAGVFAPTGVVALGRSDWQRCFSEAVRGPVRW